MRRFFAMRRLRLRELTRLPPAAAAPSRTNSIRFTVPPRGAAPADPRSRKRLIRLSLRLRAHLRQPPSSPLRHLPVGDVLPQPARLRPRLVLRLFELRP